MWPKRHCPVQLEAEDQRQEARGNEEKSMLDSVSPLRQVPVLVWCIMAWTDAGNPVSQSAAGEALKSP